MVKVVVDRQRWLRGEQNSYLLRVDGKMCCIGFLAKVAGADDADILQRGVLDSVERTRMNTNKRPLSLLYKFVDRIEEDNEDEYGGLDFPLFIDKGFMSAFYSINDDSTISDEQREALLISHGRDNGVEFEFVG